MGSLIIDKDDLEIRVEGKALVFYENGIRQGSSPLQPIDRVIIIGNKKIETSVLTILAANNISTIFLSGRRLSFKGILHGRLHNNGHLRIQQYKKSLEPFSLTISKEIVETKLRNQLDLLRELKELNSKYAFEMQNSIFSLEKIMRHVSEQVSIESLMGIEGSAANVYFKTYALAFPESLRFRGRMRRPPGDPVNALLSLGYTMLHFEMVREIELIGLDLTIGFYHKFEYGRESLACDLIEEFRPAMDKFVFNAFKNRIFREDDFTYFHDNERPCCYLKKSKRKDYFKLYEEWVRLIRSKMTAKVQELSRRILNE